MKFKIKPNPKENYYFNVYVFNTENELNSFLSKLHGKEVYCRACFSYNKKKNLLGTISFSKTNFCLRFITHECLHATWEYMRHARKRVTKYSKEEEMFCGTHEYLYSQILNRRIKLVKSRETPKAHYNTLKYYYRF